MLVIFSNYFIMIIVLRFLHVDYLQHQLLSRRKLARQSYCGPKRITLCGGWRLDRDSVRWGGVVAERARAGPAVRAPAQGLRGGEHARRARLRAAGEAVRARARRARCVQLRH